MVSGDAMKTPMNPLERGIYCIREIAEGRMEAEEYFRYKLDARGRLMLPWLELIWVRKNNIALYRRFLLQLSLFDRRTVLLQEEILGYTQTELYNLFGIHKDLISKLMGRFKKKKRNSGRIRQPEIRSVSKIHINDIDEGILSFMSILMRVPLSWIIDERPEMEWTNDQWANTSCSELDLTGLISLLESSRVKQHHNVIPVLLTHGHTIMHLRVEIDKGSFLIEYSSKGLEIGSFHLLISDCLNMFPNKMEIGIIPTVIPRQYNLALHVGDSKHLLPPEYSSGIDLLKSKRI